MRKSCLKNNRNARTGRVPDFSSGTDPFLGFSWFPILNETLAENGHIKKLMPIPNPGPIPGIQPTYDR